MIRLFVAWAAACALSAPPAPGVGDPDPVQISAPVAPPSPPPPAHWLAARELRVAWSGAQGAPADLQRTPAEAEARILELRARVDAGASFEDLVRVASDAPSAARGGWIGTWEVGTLDAALEAALLATPVGGRTTARTAAGWHLLERGAADVRRLRWAAWGHAHAHRSTSLRSRVDAIALATAQVEAWTHDPQAPAAGPDRAGPEAGAWIGPDQWPVALHAAAWALDEGAATVVDAPQGVYAVVRLDGAATAPTPRSPAPPATP